MPAGLGIDTYEGRAWVTLIPSPQGEQGSYFFSLEASSWLASAGARLAYALPYFPAVINRRKDANGAIIRYRSRRRLGGHRAGLEVVWRIGSSVPFAAPKSLDHFLIER